MTASRSLATKPDGSVSSLMLQVAFTGRRRTFPVVISIDPPMQHVFYLETLDKSRR